MFITPIFYFILKCNGIFKITVSLSLSTMGQIKTNPTSVEIPINKDFLQWDFKVQFIHDFVLHGVWFRQVFQSFDFRHT